MKQKMIYSLMFVLTLIGCQNPLTNHGKDYASDIVAIYSDSTHHTLIFWVSDMIMCSLSIVIFPL